MPRAGRPVKRLVSAVWRAASLCQRRTVQGAGEGFGREHVGGADLHAGGAQRHGGGHAVCIGNAAGRDDRHANRTHHLRQQRKGAELRRQVVREKVPAMAAGLQPLGNDGVDTLRLQPQRLVDRGGGGEDLRAPSAHLGQQRLGRQPEMKAHHRRTELGQHLGHRLAEGVAPGASGNGCRIDVVLAVIRRQRVAPCRLAFGAWLRRHVAEEVDVVGLACARADGAYFGANGVVAQHGARQRAEPARVADGNGHCAALNARHGRLDQREFGT